MTAEWFQFENASSVKSVPQAEEHCLWIEKVFCETQAQRKELSIRIVDSEEMQQLNFQYRDQDKVTNVLSFPFIAITEQQSNLAWGDIVICAPVVVQQAAEQHKSEQSHWAHMTIHGALHLLGFDHHRDQQAAQMETLEQSIMRRFGFADPYEEP